MKLLPARHVNCALPVPPAFRAYGKIIPSGESAAHWIWTWPRLLGWGRTINWLFPRVFDSPRKACWNLWGIDSVGYLVIAETSVDLQQTLRDPFRNLLSAHEAQFNSQSSDTRQLCEEWRRFMAERDGRLGFPPAAASNFGSLMGQSAYERAIEKALALHEAAGNSPPALIPLISSHQADFRLSAETEKNWLFLQKLAGSSRFLPRGINATLGVKGLRIHCWSPQSTTSDNRGWLPPRRVLMH